MNIYFGGSISGGRDYLKTYQTIVNHLKEKNHHILTEHVVDPNVIEMENGFTNEEIYTRDIQWLTSCDCLVAEVSNPSLGVGYEICYALRIDKPVLCLYKEGVFLTRMLTGNHSKNLMVKQYKDEQGFKITLDEFLSSL
jgi:2'-deoxynucleoside 5'-phosphate N-hydrolase